MPQIFKALATITVWILFVFGCIAILGGFVRVIGMSLDLFPATFRPPLVGAYFGGGIVSLILSVVAMKLRQTME